MIIDAFSDPMDGVGVSWQDALLYLYAVFTEKHQADFDELRVDKAKQYQISPSYLRIIDHHGHSFRVAIGDDNVYIHYGFDGDFADLNRDEPVGAIIHILKNWGLILEKSRD